MDTFYFYIPNRLTWNHWKEFMGENTASAYLPEVEYRPPRINFGTDELSVNHGVINVGDIADYLGIPPKFSFLEDNNPNWILANYLRSYWLVWNEFFRDQNLDDPINIPLGEYQPNQIKQAVTGTAAADKKLVERYVKTLLGLKTEPKPDHAADALAGAITHLHYSRKFSFIL